jgi:hypothetical protein
LAGRVADHRGEVTDEEYGCVPEVLEIPNLLQEHAVAEVKVRPGWIEARLDPQRPVHAPRFLEALFELGAHVKVFDAALEPRELVGYRKE